MGAAPAKIDATKSAPSTKRAIGFAALTAVREIEVRRATWEQLDLEAVAAESMKTGKAHRGPLSNQALGCAPPTHAPTAAGGLVFPGSRPGAMTARALTYPGSL